MKKLLFSIMAVVGACTFFACSNGDYIANPTSNANNSVNPLNVLDSAAFSWTGSDAISAYVNGTYVHIDSNHTSFYLSSVDGSNNISGILGVSHGFVFVLKNVYAGSVYDMSYNDFDHYVSWSDSVDTPRTYYSYLGNVGQIQIERNDPLRMIAKFHFQALDKVNGIVMNISNGWMNIHK